MSSKNGSPDSNKENTNHNNNNSYSSSFNPLIEGLTLAQSSAIALIIISSEILEAAPHRYALAPDLLLRLFRTGYYQFLIMMFE